MIRLALSDLKMLVWLMRSLTQPTSLCCQPIRTSNTLKVTSKTWWCSCRWICSLSSKVNQTWLIYLWPFAPSSSRVVTSWRTWSILRKTKASRTSWNNSCREWTRRRRSPTNFSLYMWRWRKPKLKKVVNQTPRKTSNFNTSPPSLVSKSTPRRSSPTFRLARHLSATLNAPSSARNKVSLNSHSRKPRLAPRFRRQKARWRQSKESQWKKR